MDIYNMVGCTCRASSMRFPLPIIHAHTHVKQLLHEQVSGYSHKLPVLLDRVARRIASYLQELKGKGDEDPEVR